MLYEILYNGVGTPHADVDVLPGRIVSDCPEEAQQPLRETVPVEKIVGVIATVIGVGTVEAPATDPVIEIEPAGANLPLKSNA